MRECDRATGESTLEGVDGIGPTKRCLRRPDVSRGCAEGRGDRRVRSRGGGDAAGDTRRASPTCFPQRWQGEGLQLSMQNRSCKRTLASRSGRQAAVAPKGSEATAKRALRHGSLRSARARQTTEGAARRFRPPSGARRVDDWAGHVPRRDRRNERGAWRARASEKERGERERQRRRKRGRERERESASDRGVPATSWRRRRRKRSGDRGDTEETSEADDAKYARLRGRWSPHGARQGAARHERERRTEKQHAEIES